MSPALEMALDRVHTFVGYMAWMLFFYLFPSGRFVPRWTALAGALLGALRGFVEFHAFRPAHLATLPLQREHPRAVG